MLRKQHYVALAQACQEIEAGLQDACFVEGSRGVDEVMELVVARIAWMCSQGNPAFDSFKFNAAARKRNT